MPEDRTLSRQSADDVTVQWDGEQVQALVLAVTELLEGWGYEQDAETGVWEDHEGNELAKTTPDAIKALFEEVYKWGDQGWNVAGRELEEARERFELLSAARPFLGLSMPGSLAHRIDQEIGRV